MNMTEGFRPRLGSGLVWRPPKLRDRPEQRAVPNSVRWLVSALLLSEAAAYVVLETAPAAHGPTNPEVVMTRITLCACVGQGARTHVHD
jgi:hypothetical protein